MLRCKSFDGSLRANRRENGSDQLTMRCGEYACAGAIIFGGDREIKHGIDCKRELGDFHEEISEFFDSDDMESTPYSKDEVCRSFSVQDMQGNENENIISRIKKFDFSCGSTDNQKPAVIRGF